MRTSSEPVVKYMAHRIDHVMDSLNESMEIPGKEESSTCTVHRVDAVDRAGLALSLVLALALSRFGAEPSRPLFWTLKGLSHQIRNAWP
jgi:hypothetical protein